MTEQGEKEARDYHHLYMESPSSCMLEYIFVNNPTYLSYSILSFQSAMQILII